MVFNPGLKRNQVIDNKDLCSIFKCSPQGGMRRSHRTNTLVVVSNRTTDYYGDKWNGPVLDYVGMGLIGDQKKDFAQNKTLADSRTNGVKIHLFEVLEKRQYTYRGEVKLAEEPKTDNQKDFKGNERIVWIFPLKAV
jgi:5-methylcytosine-specific restriction protein A